MADPQRPYSSIVVDGVEQAPSRAMLYPVGFTREDFTKPQVGIASTWSMVTPCNMHINELADAAAMGADEAGGQERPVQHHHRLRRHLHGHARNALFRWCRGR